MVLFGVVDGLPLNVRTACLQLFPAISSTKAPLPNIVSVGENNLDRGGVPVSGPGRGGNAQTIKLTRNPGRAPPPQAHSENIFDNPGLLLIDNQPIAIFGIVKAVGAVFGPHNFPLFYLVSFAPEHSFFDLFPFIFGNGGPDMLIESPLGGVLILSQDIFNPDPMTPEFFLHDQLFGQIAAQPVDLTHNDHLDFTLTSQLANPVQAG